MIDRIVKLTIINDKVPLFLEHTSKIQKKVASYEGCKSLKILNDTHDNRIFITYSVWVSEEALDNYRASEFFRTNWKIMKKWFADLPEAWTTTNTFYDEKETCCF